jgi:hypothetical protein
MKQGGNFERLVSWISSCLHRNAVITPNDKLIDKFTGKKRQIDISIKVTNGPIEFIAIVEARDRSRPVGISYVEEINQKKESVNANIAIIVSNQGFYQTALIKAKAYGIQTITLKKALSNDWSKTLQHFKGIISHNIRIENATLYLLDSSTNTIINPNADFKNKIEGKVSNELLFTNEEGKPFVSMINVLNLATSNNELRNHLEKLNGKKERMKLIIDTPKTEKVYFIDENNQRRPFERYCLVGDFWIETELLNPEILQYGSTEDKLHAEIIKIKDEMDILIENPNAIDKDRSIYIRLKNNIL